MVAALDRNESASYLETSGFPREHNFFNQTETAPRSTTSWAGRRPADRMSIIRKVGYMGDINS